MILTIGPDSVDLGNQSNGSGAQTLRLNQSQEYSAGADSSDVIIYTVSWPQTEILTQMIINEITEQQYADFAYFHRYVAVGAVNPFAVLDDDLSTWTGRFTSDPIRPTRHGLRVINGVGPAQQAYGLNFPVLRYP